MNKYNFQVGDYCLCTSIGNKVVKITDNYSQINPPFKRMFRVQDDSGLTWCVPEEECLPIEITDEWLSLSFEFHHKGYKLWQSKDLRLTISTITNMAGRDYDVRCVRRVHLNNEFMETLGSIPACYVHHIQHLCRDCEYEFEPKFK